MACSVFVGNIPYDATEDQLRAIFGEVGPIVSFRLVTDRASGQVKGFGFCEYRDAETAASAMRNLNGREFLGRNLRVDVASNDKASSSAQSQPHHRSSRRRSSSSSTATSSSYGRHSSSSFASAPVKESAMERIQQIIASTDPSRLHDVVACMKSLCADHPSEALAVCRANPGLVWAVTQARVALGMGHGVLLGADGSAMQQPHPYAASAAAVDPHRALMDAMQTAQGPSGGAPLVAPPPGMDAQQWAQLVQVMQLSPQQIAALAPQQQALVLQLKEHARNLGL